MSINLGLTSKDPFNCIVGFSGKIIDKEDLSLRLISKTKTLLIHGEKDEIVPPYNLLEAKDFFTRNNICLLYTSPSPRDVNRSRMPSSA